MPKSWRQGHISIIHYLCSLVAQSGYGTRPWILIARKLRTIAEDEIARREFEKYSLGRGGRYDWTNLATACATGAPDELPITGILGSSSGAPVARPGNCVSARVVALGPARGETSGRVVLAREQPDGGCFVAARGCFFLSFRFFMFMLRGFRWV